MSEHVEAGRLGGPWCWDEDSAEIEVMQLEWATLEYARCEARDRQKELELSARVIRLQRQAEIHREVPGLLGDAARQLKAVLVEHGVTWQGVLRSGVVRVNCYDMHRYAVVAGRMWCGWSAPWANVFGDDPYPISEDLLREELLAVGLECETWRSDIGISCTVGWPQ